MRSTKNRARYIVLNALEAERNGEKSSDIARRLGVSRAGLSQAKTRAKANVKSELEYWMKVYKLVSRETSDVSETGD